MQVQEEELEPMEAFLEKLVPGIANECQGATSAEMSQIERLAGRPLPGFYRWFLTRMGRGMGPLTYPTLDHSVQKILACYSQGVVAQNERFLMIAFESNNMMPLHKFYDFEYPSDDDARVVLRHAMGGTAYDQFDTFREMLAWHALLILRVEKFPQRCSGLFTDDDSEDVLGRLGPVMESLGFEIPLKTGAGCGLFDGPEAAMVTSSTPTESNDMHGFVLGGKDVAHLRHILGEIAIRTSFELTMDEWDPYIDSE
jgi:hypothetical protein